MAWEGASVQMCLPLSLRLTRVTAPDASVGCFRPSSELGPGVVLSSRSGLLNVATVLEMAAFCPKARLNIGTN